jgi:gamma-glutamylcyclotransferase (GGCT)/AIG2-like uncharacterized protein YtfP
MSSTVTKTASEYILYFAYGSNMSVRRLQARVPSAQLVCNAELRGHQLCFHKRSHVDGSAKCDACVTGDPEDTVQGVVFRFKQAEKPLLDQLEGLGKGYEVKLVQLLTRDGQTVCAYTYIATDIDATLKPFDWYKTHVLTGAREHTLPADYIDRIAAIEAWTDADNERCRRELSVYL